MNKNRHLQLFATDLTDTAALDVAAREIDFVTSFGAELTELLNAMGVTRAIKKANGTVLKTKIVSGTLKSGVVAEGAEIPLSQYKVKETAADSISIEKYRKAVTLEAIAEKGYEVAVADTDAEFKSDLQVVVLEKFYDQLKLGTLTVSKGSFQMAVATAIGEVKNKFKKMRRGVTGVVVFVNTLDVYEYLGGAQVSIQSAFGMDYIENFLGADKVFITSEIEQGEVYATPYNNIVTYYVDPSDSEFAKAGLPFTTDSETGFVGFHAQGNYVNAQAEVFAVMGVRLFAEHLDGIAKVTIDASQVEVQAGE